MNDKSRPDSTMTKLMRSSAEDALLHRALTLPSRFPQKIVLTDSEGRSVETKYVFDAPEPVGEGGTAIVYRVRDTQLGVIRALKVLLVDIRSNSVADQRWRRERDLLIALEKVDAPCVPTIYDVGIAAGLPLIIMQFVEGVTLAEKITELDKSESPITLENAEKRLGLALEVVTPLVGSLAHIERHFERTENQGFAHGDIKPSNIIVENLAENVTRRTPDVGRVWLLDFGEASVREVSEARGLTPAYSSPEQLTDWASQRSPRVTPATDQYQLGVVLQDLLRPIESYTRYWPPSAISVAWKRNYLSGVAKKMTARRPTDRFANFKQLAQALERANSLPRRYLLAAGLVVATVSMVSLLLLSARGRSNSLESRPVDTQFVTTTVENEWNRWQGTSLWGASVNQIEGQIATQQEQWRAAYGTATSDAIAAELNRRLSMLRDGQYTFRIVSAIPDDTLNQTFQQFPDQAPDEVTVTLSVGDRDVLTMRGKMSAGKPVTFDASQGYFHWNAGQKVELFIRTTTAAEQQKRERDDARFQQELQEYNSAKERYEKALADYKAEKENGQPAVPPPPFVKMRPFEVFGFSEGWRSFPVGGDHTDGGAMAIPSETKCVRVDDRTFVGEFDQDSINWHIEVSPAQ